MKRCNNKPPCYSPVQLPLPSEKRPKVIHKVNTLWVSVCGALLGCTVAYGIIILEKAGVIYGAA